MLLAGSFKCCTSGLAWEQCSRMKRQVLSELPADLGSQSQPVVAARAVRPIAEEIPYRDPLELYAPFADDPHAVLLESAVTDGIHGRYSYIAMEPFQFMASKNGNI